MADDNKPGTEQERGNKYFQFEEIFNDIMGGEDQLDPSLPICPLPLRKTGYKL